MAGGGTVLAGGVGERSEWRRMTVQRYRFGPYVLDPAARELRRDDVPQALQARVFECLSHLLEARERAVSRDELAQAMFGRRNVSDAQVAQIVLRARRAVGDDGQAQHTIRTVPRFGFRWVAPVVLETGNEPAGGAGFPGAEIPTADASMAGQDEEPHSDGSQATPDRAATSSQANFASSDLPAPPPRRTPRRGAVVVVAAVLGSALALAWWAWRGTAPAPMSANEPVAVRSTLVLPVEVEGGGGEAAWARLGLMDFLADRLRRAGVAVPPSENTLVLLGSADAAMPALSPKQGQRIVRGVASRSGEAWAVRVEARTADGIVLRAEGRHAALLQAATLAADRLLSSLGLQAPAGDAAPALRERLQRARAAMLANEVEQARRLLDQAPELERGSPELLYQLARIEFREGRFEEGLAGLDRAMQAASDQPPEFHARLLNARGAMLVRLERSVEAESDYTAAIALVAQGHYPAELTQALTGRGVARAMQRRFDAALADLGQARIQAERAGDLLAASRIDANLGQVELDRGRPAQALPYLQQAAHDFEQHGAVNELLIARSSLVAIQLRLLRSDLALAEHARAWALRARVRDPAQTRMLALDRAAILLRQGRLREARELLAPPQGSAVPTAEAQRRGALQVETAWREGDIAATLRLAAARLEDPQPDPVVEGWTRLRQRQAALAGDATMAAWPSALATAAWMPSLATALGERQAGNVAAADAAYREALRAVEAGGVPEEIVAVVADYAPWLIERDRASEASALVGRVAPWAERDFDAAMLEARLYAALGQPVLSARAAARVRALAGDRPVPADLAAASGPRGPE